ncbi:MAG TPA: aspartate carbamoyltransferase catalytic subunit, partial [Candidatus Eremiobacteraceae bacterium]|nr:aspartate carbamoyltransferase catalytic subunit [Candidatus Eremiobacteraceae bacterium]
TGAQHFLDLDDAQRPALEALIVRAHAFKKGVPDAGVRLRGRTIVGMFFEPSTRTANSFAVAAQQLGAHWLAFDTGGSSMSKGESIEDTARTIAAIGADAIVVRHQESGFPHALARHFNGAVINAGDGWHAHPTPGVLDAMTLVEELGSLEGRRLVIAGDIRHSRVARSSARAMWLLGARVTLCAPPLLLTLSAPGWGFADLATDLDKCLPTADALMLLRIQKERVDASELPPFEDLTSGYGLTPARMAKLPPHAVIMHPGPVNRGLEIDDSLVTHERSRIERQVQNGVYARMAVLERCLRPLERAAAGRA